MLANFTKLFQSKVLTVYRLASFVVLTSILTGVFSYIGLLLFYIANSSWAAPLVLSPTQQHVLAYQPQVLQAKTQLEEKVAQLDSLRQQVELKKRSLQQLTELLERNSAAQRIETARLRGAAAALTELSKAKSSDIRASEEILTSLRDVTGTTSKELLAGLITKDDATTRLMAYRSAANGLTDSRLTATQVKTSAGQLNSAAETLGGGSTDLQALSTLQQAHQLRYARDQVAADIKASGQSIAVLESAIKAARTYHDQATQSPYFKAMSRPVTAAFVPYDNIDSARPGAPVYDCTLQILACSKVGTLKAVFDAEEYGRHPLFRHDLKGKFVEVEFDDAAASSSRVVFLGHKPLVF